MRTTLFLLPLIFFFAVPVWAGNCGAPVDMRAPGGSMEVVPVMDQDGFPLCYSYAAAQMADAYWKKNHKDQVEPSFQSSPVGAAVERAAESWFYRTFHDPLKQGGWTCDMVDQLRDHGACDHAVVTQHVFTSEVKGRLENYRVLHDSYAELNSKIDALESEARNGGYLSSHTAEDEAKSAIASTACRMASNTPLNQKSIASITQLLEGANAYEFVREAAIPTCSHKGNRRKPPLPKCKSSSHIYSGKSGIQKIHALLDQPNPLPIGISYCSKVLEKGRSYQSSSSRKLLDLLSGSENCGPHASLIIGRRTSIRSDGSAVCQFLIRNTWGTSCWNYSNDWDCEKGNIWVDSDQMTTSLLGIQYLEGDSK